MFACRVRTQTLLAAAQTRGACARTAVAGAGVAGRKHAQEAGQVPDAQTPVSHSRQVSPAPEIRPA